MVTTINVYWCNGKLILFIPFLCFLSPLLLMWIDLNRFFQIKILSCFEQSENESFIKINCCMVTMEYFLHVLNLPV
jgi:hypothetical protein